MIAITYAYIILNLQTCAEHLEKEMRAIPFPGSQQSNLARIKPVEPYSGKIKTEQVG